MSDRERLGLVTAAEPWLEMRRLRNRLVHEYIERPDDLAVALQRACRLTDPMHGDYLRMREYAHMHLGVETSG